MFTPPKSKSPWEAMTAGSTGGWAAGLQGLGPVLAGAAGMIPVVGPALSTIGGAAGMLGGGTGFQGTDKGWGNVQSTLLGALGGYGAGALGKGIGTGAMNMLQGSQTPVLNKFLAGFGGGMKDYFGTNIIPGIQGTSGSNIASGVKNMFNFGATQNPLGQVSPMGGSFAKGTGWVAGAPDQLREAMGASQSPFSLNLGNVAAMTLGGAQGLLGMFGLRGDKEEALSKVYTPALMESRGMIRDLALTNPSELIGPASDQFVEATLRQSRDAAKRQKEETLSTFSAQGKLPGQSGSVDKYLQDFDKAQVQREQDWITSVNESRQLAATKLKVQAVTAYYGVAEDEALNLLAAEGYINPIDAQNYLNAMEMMQFQMQMNALQGLY